MRTYNEWNKLQNLKGIINFEHFLFGLQTYKCDAIQIVNDADKIGVVIKKKELFVYKHKIIDFYVNGDTYAVGDGALKIIVKLFKKC